MLVVLRGNSGEGEALVAACDVCGRVFDTLKEAWLAFDLPAQPGDRAEVVWVHKQCTDASRIRWRLDIGLRWLIHGETVVEADPA
jgi:hypothetical protein